MSIEDKATEVKQSFGVYDVFGYILPGFFFLSLFIIDYDCSKILKYFVEHGNLKGIEDANINFKLKYLLDFLYFDSSQGFGLVTFLMFTFFCYLTGHIISSISSLLAKLTIKLIFKSPTENLFVLRPRRDYKTKLKKSDWYQKIFVFIESILYFIFITFIFKKVFLGIVSMNYRKPFEEEFRNQFKKAIDNTFGYDVKTRDYYWLVSAYINAKHQSCVRTVKHFVNLSGFTRNISGAITTYILLRIIAHFLLGSKIDAQTLKILVVYSFTIPILLWSYMRLYKRQAVEMYYMFYSLRLKKDEN